MLVKGLQLFPDTPKEVAVTLRDLMFEEILAVLTGGPVFLL